MSERKIHENVELIRKAKGVTKTYLAQKIGLSLQGYRHIANGATTLDAERLRILADALCVNVSVFFDKKLTDSVTNNADKVGDKFLSKTG